MSEKRDRGLEAGLVHGRIFAHPHEGHIFNMDAFNPLTLDLGMHPTRLGPRGIARASPKIQARWPLPATKRLKTLAPIDSHNTRGHRMIRTALFDCQNPVG